MTERQDSQAAIEAPEVQSWRSILLIALIVSVLIVLGIIAVVWSTTNPEKASSCKTSNYEPYIDSSSIEPIASKDNRVLVRLAGFLEFSYKDQTDVEYLELKLTKVRHTTDSGDGEKVKLELSMDCAKLDMIVSKDTGRKEYTVEEIFIRSLHSDSGSFERCRIQVGAIIFGFDWYFSCHSGLLYKCEYLRGNGRIVEASANFNLFDLEIDGDKRSIKSRQFDLKPLYCPH